MQFVIDNKALIQVDSTLNTVALWSQIILYERTLLHTNKNPVCMFGCNGFACNRSLLGKVSVAKGAIRADAKCRTYIAYNDFFQRESC